MKAEHSTSPTLFLILALCIFAVSRGQAQVEKIFVDGGRVFRAERIHNRWVALHIAGKNIQDTASVNLEVFNTGRYEYHSVAWCMTDSFLYAAELMRADGPFARAQLMRFTIPSTGALDLRQIQQSMAYFNYIQKLDQHLFFVSERCLTMKTPPMYFDFTIDQKGVIILAILEIDQKLLYIYSKSIARYKQEDADKIPGYLRTNTWDAVDTISTQLRSPFGLVVENGRYYIADSEGRLYEAAGHELIERKNLKNPVALVFDRQFDQPVQYVPLGQIGESKFIRKAVLKKRAKKLIDP